MGNPHIAKCICAACENARAAKGHPGPFGLTRTDVINGIQQGINGMILDKNPTTSELLAVATSFLVSLHRKVGGSKDDFILLIAGAMTIACGTEADADATLKRIQERKRN